MGDMLIDPWISKNNFKTYRELIHAFQEFLSVSGLSVNQNYKNLYYI